MDQDLGDNLNMFSLPLTDEQLIQYIQNTDKVYDIQYSKTLNDNSLIYLANLNIKCNLICKTQEELNEALLSYMKLQTLCTIKNFEKYIVKIILIHNKLNLEDFCPELTINQCLNFINNNIDIINRYEQFLDSLYYYIIYKCLNITDKFNFQNTPIIEDRDYVGVNIVNLFYIKELMMYFFIKNKTKQYNFKYQFEEYMFNNDNLYFYLADSKFPLLSFLEGLINIGTCNKTN